MDPIPYSDQRQISVQQADFTAAPGGLITVSFPLVARAGFVFLIESVRMFNQQVSGNGSLINYIIRTPTRILDVGQIGYGASPNDNRVIADLNNPLPMWSGSLDVQLAWGGTAAPWVDLLTIGISGKLQPG